MFPSRAILLLALPLLVLGCGGGGSEGGSPAETAAGQTGNRRPVVLISIDSLRADHCTPYGYHPQFAPDQSTTPFMERIGEEGVVFENTSAAAPWTLPSHMSIMTGMSVLQHGVRSRRLRLPDETGHIAGKFQAAGYRTAGFYSAPFLHPSWGFYQGFDTYYAAAPYLNDPDTLKTITTLGNMDAIHSHADSDDQTSGPVIDTAIRWLEKDHHYAKPFFLFVHLWDPHYDYRPPAEYARQFHPDYHGKIDGKDFYKTDHEYTPDELDHVRALYDAEIRYTDDNIARLYAKLEEWGRAQDVIFAIVSDHGDEFYEHGQKGHHKTLYEEVIHVPMVLRAPGLVPSGVRVSQTVANYDLAPTLLDLAGLEPWPDRTGKSMRPLWEDPAAPDHAVLMDLFHPGVGAFLNGWRRGKDKVIFQYREPRYRWVFDLSQDPEERHPQNLKSLASSPIGREAMDAFRDEQRRAHRPAPMKETEKMTTQLAELGYAGE